MRVSIETRNAWTGRASFTPAAMFFLSVVALLAPPAWSDEVPADPAEGPATRTATDVQPQGGASKAIPSTAPPDDICRPDGPCETDHIAHPPHGSLASVGAKLADPTSDIWALSFNFQGPQFFDGDLNSGSPELGGNVIFEPVMPIPLFGAGEDQWKLITRPVVPIIFSQPSPTGINKFNHPGGLGDIQLPLLLNPSSRILGNWIFAAGPVFEFPTSTNDALGAQQFSIGPAVAVGYKNKLLTAVIFPNYFFGFADRSDRKASTPTTSKLSLLYSLTFNLPQAWQVGFNPTISYNNKAASGNKWNVPVGLFVGRTIKIGRLPVNIKLGAEYSVVSQDDFGKRFAFRFQMTPVIPGLVQKPIFGGE